MDDRGRSGGVALVTGGSHGIGLAVALMLRDLEYAVAICSRDPEAATAPGFLEPGKDDGRRGAIETLTCDVRDEASVRATVDEVIARHGRIDVLVNSAGVSMPENRNIEDVDGELWDRIIRTNLDGTYYFCREVMRLMRARGSGEIINILSTGAFNTNAGNIPYAASKYAARAITEGLQKEAVGTGIRVSAIGPGPVATDIWNHKTRHVGEEERSRMLKPADIANIVRFLITRPPYVRIGTITVTPDFPSRT